MILCYSFVHSQIHSFNDKEGVLCARPWVTMGQSAVTKAAQGNHWEPRRSGTALLGGGTLELRDWQGWEDVPTKESVDVAQKGDPHVGGGVTLGPGNWICFLSLSIHFACFRFYINGSL